ncbi:cytochrome P450, partial [Pleurotus eryngii]
FPALKYVPARWASWKGLCARAKALHDGLHTRLFTEVEQKVASGIGVGSYLGNILLNPDELEMSMDEAKAMAKVLMEAGAETSTSYLQSFVLALINFPECQKRARKELDEVVGTDRLPTFEDHPNLPHVNTFIKEVSKVS